MNIEQQIYTSCPYGKGYDKISGFQVKARSQGITDSISRAVLPYSNRYQVPRELRKMEYQCYQEGKDLLPGVLDRFPIAVTYHHVEENFFGLTRVRYLGKDYTGRAGNFHAHTLVFEPEALESFDYNPIALSRSRVFENPREDGTVLDSLADFHGYAPKEIRTDTDWMTRVSKESYAASYEAVLSAVVHQLHHERSIIFCFKEYSEAVDYIEALLMLFPPEMRCRITFTSYEPDPYTLIRRGRNEDTANHLHLVTTIEQEKGGVFEFRPHEINQFLVWDFVGEHRSKFPEPSPYTQAVIKICAREQPAQLKQCHKLLEQLGAGRIPGSWDALILAEGLENKLSQLETRQIIPTVLEAVERVALTESQASRALDLVWPLLQKMALEESDELFPTVFKAFERLLDRLPKESTYRQELGERLMKLICNVIVSGSIPRAHILASVGQTSPSVILAEAAIQLEKKGWPQLSDQTGEPDFACILRTLEQLAQEPGMLEWVVQTLWQKVKSLAETALPENYFHQLLETLEPLMEQLPPGSALMDRVTHESIGLIQHLLKTGFPSRVLCMIEFSGNDAKTVLPGIYCHLLDEGWPGHLRINQDSRDEDQKAFTGIMPVVVEAVLEEKVFPGSVFQGLVPAFGIAHLYGFADKLWLGFKTDLLKRLSPPSDTPTAVNFVERIKEILSAYHCPDEIFQLLLWQINAQTPGSLQQWKQRVSELMQQGVRCHEPAQQTNDIFKFIAPPLSRQEQIILLAVLFHEAIGLPQVQVIITKKYQEILNSLPSPGEAWEVRFVLTQEGQAAWSFLMKDFIDKLDPWPENGREQLHDWQTYIFSKNPAIISFAAEFLAQILGEGKNTWDELKLCMEYLELFGESSKEQCLPLLAAFIAKAPMATVVENWKSWFDRANLRHQVTPEANQRADLISWIKKIEARISTGDPDAQKTIKYLQNWQKRRSRLDPGARDWGTRQLLDLLGTVDLTSTKKSRELVKRSLQKYRKHDLQNAINYLHQESRDDPVTRVLQLVVIGQAGMEHVKEPDGKILAEIVFEVTKNLPADKRDFFWKLLADRAAGCDPPATEVFQSFRRMTKPTARFVLKGRRLFDRVLKREGRGPGKVEKKLKGGKHE
jgi:hypothetical protein